MTWWTVSGFTRSMGTSWSRVQIPSERNLVNG
jgi:hypothetical protein